MGTLVNHTCYRGDRSKSVREPCAAAVAWADRVVRRAALPTPLDEADRPCADPMTISAPANHDEFSRTDWADESLRPMPWTVWTPMKR